MGPELSAALLSGTVEAIVSSIVQPAFAALVGKIRTSLGKKPKSALDAAMAEGVERCLPLVAGQFTLGGADAQDRARALLGGQAFLEEATRGVLFDERPNLKALAQAYRRAAEAEGRQPSDAEIEAVRDLALRSLDQMRHHLLTHPVVGEVVRDTRDAALKADLNSMEMLAVAREMAANTARTATATEKSAELLGEIRDRLPIPPSQSPFTFEESTYLKRLDLLCNRLPLAEEGPAGGERGGRPVLLRNVYVDLATTKTWPVGRVLERLGVPEEDRAALLAELGPEGAAPARRRGAAKAEQPFADPVGLSLGLETFPRFGRDSRWRQWVKSEEGWRRAVEVTALEALEEHKHLVLLGGPGSGKSTWVNFLSLTFAAGLRGAPAGWREALGTGLASPLFPLHVQLRRCHGALTGEEGLDGLYQAISSLTKIPPAQLLSRLDRTDTVVFFDGLDEVPAGESGGGEAAARPRSRVATAIRDFVTVHDTCRVVVTCRIKPFDAGGFDLGAMPVFTLAELDRGRIDRFVTRWYQELELGGRLEAHEVAPRRSRLLEVSTRRDDVARMAKSPLLLTMLAQVNARAPLPEGRPELYEACVEQLLWKWEKRVAEWSGVRSLDDLVDKHTRPAFERALWRLAFQARAGELELTDAIQAEELRAELVSIRPAHDGDEWKWAQQVMDLMADRGGVLVENEPGIFSFPHPSFGEFLAARWLLESGEGPALARHLGEDDRWQEVVPLATGFLTFKGRFPEVETLLAHMVLGASPTTPREWRRVLLAAHAYWSFGPHRVAAVGLGAELKQRLPILLGKAQHDESLEEPLRCEAGLLLGDLGEKPAGLGSFVTIPKGQHGAAFRIGKYPVTNAELGEFVAAGGYNPDRSWWSEEAKSEILDFQKTYFDGQWPRGPHWANDEQFNHPTQPVVGISWYEAMAYCAWLSREGRIEEGETARLPTTAEWQRACGGEEKWPFPWGKKAFPGRANTQESGLGRPSPVDLYPGGASPEGVWDLAGNVWEWVMDEKGDLLGGAYWDELEKVGTSARYGYPWGRSYYIGFRVVLVPSSRRSSGS